MDQPTSPAAEGETASAGRGIRKVPLLHKTGLHMRPAGRIMELACKYKSSIRLGWADRSANAKSILEMLSLAAPPGAELVLEAEGSDAEEALDAIEALIRTRINPEEDV
jgi:phosphotransferase system HPr (HPr) family protein